MALTITGTLAACLLPGQLLAQPTNYKRVEQINAAQAASARDTAEQRKELMGRAAALATPGKINISPATKANVGVIDPEAIAKQYAQVQHQAPGKRDEDKNEVMVFVSLSMPKASLERASRDTRKAGAALVMRGVTRGVGPGRWAQSMAALEPITKNGGEVSLHPDLFERYGIKRVPAVVVATEPTGGCSEDSCREYAVVYGDVTLSYSLDRLTDRTDAIGAIARQRLAKLEQR
jgi:conjugal transfer pilus assembly protein TrbC